MIGSPLALSFFALALFGAPAPHAALSLQGVETVEQVASLEWMDGGPALRLSNVFAPCRPCPKFGLADLNSVPETVVRLVSRGIVVDSRPGDHPSISIRVRPRGSGARVRVRVRF